MSDSTSLSDQEHQRQDLSRQRFAKLLERLAQEGISQRAAAIRVNVPPQYLSDVKSGRRGLTELFARRLAEEFHFDHNWLLGYSGGMEVPESSISAASAETHKIWLPVFNHPVRGEPHMLENWDGTSVELAGAAAMRAAQADRPYVLKFGADDRNKLLIRNDLVLVSQAIDPAAELQVVRQGTKMFLARRVADDQWEPVSKTGTIHRLPLSVSGHCQGIVWRSL